MFKRIKPAIIISLAHLTAFGQSISTGSATGTVTDDGGNPLPAIQLSYRRIPKITGPVGRPALAPGEVWSQGLVSADSTGKYGLPLLAEGEYVLCAHSPIGAYLDPCRWQSAVHVSIAGTNTATPIVVMKKGVFLNIQINDPAGLLPKATGALLQPLTVGVKFGKGAYLAPDTVTTNSAGRSYKMAIPVSVPLNIWLFSRGLSIADSRGNSLTSSGALIPFQATVGQDQSFVFTVTKISEASH